MNNQTQVNNHVHSTFSFSPYSPEVIPIIAKQVGLAAVGIMDHDSVGGAWPFLVAANKVGIASTVGCEIRVDFPIGDFAVRRINNPDMPGNIYMAFHGIPANQLTRCHTFLAPIRQAREERNRQQTSRLNAILDCTNIEPIDYIRDIRSLSQAENGGSVTERHILFALALRFIDRYDLSTAAEAACKILDISPPSGKLAEFLGDPNNPYLTYDLMGLFKSHLLPRIYVQPGSIECVDVRQAVSFCKLIGAIPVYPYLGDVEESPTGDKADQKFEDEFLDDLFPAIKDLGFQGLTYMPPRNTTAQLVRIRQLCREFEMIEISGVDINSPRQNFRTPILDRDEFGHLRMATWALIAHEKLSAVNRKYGLFSTENPIAGKNLIERLNDYAVIGKKYFWQNSQISHMF